MSGGWVLYRRQESGVEFLGEQDWVSQISRALVLASHQVAQALVVEVRATCTAPIDVVTFDAARDLVGVEPAVRQSMAEELARIALQLRSWRKEGVERNVLSLPKVELLETIEGELLDIAARMHS